MKGLAKRIFRGSMVFLTFVIPGQAQKAGSDAGQQTLSSAPPASNPLKVALLHWYKANVTTRFPVEK
jgi:hypothetical protein